MGTPIPPNRARFLLAEVALATKGTVTHRRAEKSDEPLIGITSDSRAVTPGCIFVALRGESHDGHAFVGAAVKSGARVLVVERKRGLELPEEASIVEVEDTLVAWGALAKAHLTKWRTESVDGRVIAITGSAGKTTTKELAAALLLEVGPTHFTAGNLNNRIGVPAVIFGLEKEHQYCVLEMGMSLPGELDAITEIAKPDLSVIVNIGVAHAEGLGGGHEAVMNEKGAVYRALGPEGTAIVNTDDEWCRRAARRARVRKVETFGRGNVMRGRAGSFAEESMPSLGALPQPPRGVAFGDSSPSLSGGELAALETSRTSTNPPMSGGPTAGPSSDRLGGAPHYRIVDRFPEKAGSRLTISCAGRELSLYLPLPGEAAAIDLIAAIAVQEAASRELLSTQAIAHALSKMKALHGRGTVRVLTGDILLLDDTYNANPASVRAALKTLGEVAGPGRRRVAILGEMKELGDLAEPEHDALGDAIADARIALAIGCGGLISRALDRAQMADVEVVPSSSTDRAAAEAIARVRSGDAVLVKGSRGVGTERIVAALIAKAPEVLPNSSESASDGTG